MVKQYNKWAILFVDNDNDTMTVMVLAVVLGHFTKWME